MPVAVSSILERIGGTPLVRLGFLETPGVEIHAKLEGDNPAGSVKDRAALSMIVEAEKSGALKPGVTILEPTSGNTGIALAMIASLKGYPIELIMPDNSSLERKQAMEAYGAKVILTPADKQMEGAIDLARVKNAAGGYYFINQFGNPANPLAHEQGTGPEIWNATGGRITHFVSAMGTTGTIMGVSRFLKSQKPATQIIGAQPAEGSHIPGIRRWPEAYRPAIFDPKAVDRVMDVSAAEARAMARRLAREAGIFAGMSSGGAVHLAAKVAGELSASGQSAVIVAIICDRGDRYLSTDLFATGD